MKSWAKSIALGEDAVSEASLTAEICKGLESLGALVLPMVGGAKSSGLPDRLVVYRNWKGFIEFKTMAGVARENQRLTMLELQRRGFPAVVVRLEKTASGKLCGDILTYSLEHDKPTIVRSFAGNNPTGAAQSLLDCLKEVVGTVQNV